MNSNTLAPHGDSGQNYWRPLSTAIASVFVGTATLIALTLLMHSDLRSEQSRAMDEIMGATDAIHGELRSTLKQLHAIEDTGCSGSHLLQMRRFMYNSNLIKDIGYYSGEELQCTTGVGKLDPPMSNADAPPPTAIVEGVGYWANIRLLMFDEVVPSLVVKVNAYNAVVDPSQIEQAVMDNIEWEIVLRAGDNAYEHIAGQKQLYLYGPIDGAIFGWVNPTLRQCSNKIPFCVATHVSNKSIIDTYNLPLFFVLIVASLSSIVSFYLLRSAAKKLLFCGQQSTPRLAQGFVLLRVPTIGRHGNPAWSLAVRC